MKIIVLDSSTLISISEKCFLKVLEKLVKIEGIELLVPEKVEIESIERPLHIKQFELNAVRIKKAVKEGWLKVRKADENAKRESNKILELANNCFFSKGQNIKVMHSGEAETIALALSMNASALGIDERNTRMLSEQPSKFAAYLNEKHDGVKIDRKKLQELNDLISSIPIVRSAELIALAFKKGCFVEELGSEGQALEAALYALKYSGCAVSTIEIQEFLQSTAV